MTDITLDLCILKSHSIKIQKPLYTFSTPKIIPAVSSDLINGDKFINISILNNVTSLLMLSSDPKFLTVANSINQFTQLNTDFMSPDAVKMANLDALTNITKHKHGVLTPHTYDPDTSVIDLLSPEYKSEMLINPVYVDFYAAPGGFTEYLLWRIPKVVGFGFNPKEREWNRSLLKSKDLYSQSTFTPIYDVENEIGTKEIREDEFRFVGEITEKKANLGVDFVIANGNLSVIDTILQILYAVLILRTGGDFLVKLNNSWDKAMVDAIYICSLIFESIELLKPVTSPPWDFERYLFCKSKRSEIDQLAELLNSATEGEILFSTLPADYELWIRKMNDLLISAQLNFLNDVVKTMNGETVPLVEIDTDKALIIWGISKKDLPL
jgi:hypothetical protein